MQNGKLENKPIIALALMAAPSYSNAMTRWIFKILRPGEKQEAAGNSTYAGSSDDMRDGFIHFSTAEQLSGTASKYFTDTGVVHVLAFDSENWTADRLRWEPSRDDALFPHLYGPLNIAAASMEWTVERDGSGNFNLDEAINWGSSHV